MKKRKRLGNNASQTPKKFNDAPSFVSLYSGLNAKQQAKKPKN